MAGPLRAAQSLWNLGKAGGRGVRRPFAGTGWGKGAREIPGHPGQTPIYPGAPGTRLPPGGRMGQPMHTIPGARSSKGTAAGHTRPKKVFPPSAHTSGARPGIPKTDPIPAGFARRRPWTTAGGAALGLGIGSSFWPDGTPKEQPQPQQPLGLGGVPTGPAAMPDTFQSQLPGLVQRRQQERDSFLDNMQMVLGHSILLSFQNPGRESKYVENAIALLKGDAKSKGALEDAKIIEEVFKDNKVPKSAKTIYNRLVKHIGPKKAAEVSGYTLEIDKAESKAATDYMKAITDAKKARSTAIGSKAYLLEEIIAESKVVGGFEAAVDRLASQWVSGGLDLDDIYSGYVGPKTYVEMEKLARALLEGQTGGGSRQGVPVNAEVSGTEVVGP